MPKEGRPDGGFRIAPLGPGRFPMNSIEPWLVVERQLQAYNARDLPEFLAQFSADAAIHELGAVDPSSSSIAEIELRYRQLFAASPNLKAEVISRTTFGHVVVDRERIFGRMGGLESVEMLAIYEVRGGRISKLHFVR